MIVTVEQLPRLRNRVTMVDGSFDPIHEGHIAYFRAAHEFGDPVFCNIAPEQWTADKHRVLLPRHVRALVLDAIRFIDYVHCSDESTAEVLERLQPKRLVKGADWIQRGGLPEAETRVCEQRGIEIEFVDTVLNSSTALLERFMGGRE